MSRDREMFELENCDIEHETDNAILVRPEGRAAYWIPLSQVDKIERSKHQGQSKVLMTAWIARQKGFL